MRFQKHLYAAILFLAASTLLGGLTACSTYDNSTRALVSNITPYRIDIIQGQVITKELLAKISKGMPAQDVVAILGSPSVHSIMAPNQIEYVFSYKKGFSEVIRQSRVSITLDQAYKVANIDSENIYSEKEIIQKIDKK